MTGTFITVGNRRIYVRRAGTGIPVLLLHGFAEDGEIWCNQWDAMAADCCVLVPDLPGSGRSEGIDDMSIEGMADCMHALVTAALPNQTGPKGIIVIGHSMGGYIALAFAEKYGSMLKGLGLFHSTAYPDTAEKKEARKKSITFIQSHGSGPFVGQSVPNLFGNKFRTEHAAIVEELVKRYSQFEPASLIAYYQAMINRPSREEVLEAVDCPVLFIAGREDKAVPLADVLKQAHRPAISDLYVFEQAAHMGMLEEKEKSLQALRHFVNTATLTDIS